MILLLGLIADDNGIILCILTAFRLNYFENKGLATFILNYFKNKGLTTFRLNYFENDGIQGNNFNINVGNPDSRTRTLKMKKKIHIEKNTFIVVITTKALVSEA